ncbi:hypothetical protein WJX73_007495 [Symbiochloris irregularis]|uniref:Uncharacterized protein n=1 Tax=Symbiochloris irregularis TaxID=706552 RepID=A0AAW1NYB6_9CHLO
MLQADTSLNIDSISRQQGQKSARKDVLSGKKRYDACHSAERLNAPVLPACSGSRWELQDSRPSHRTVVTAVPEWDTAAANSEVTIPVELYAIDGAAGFLPSAVLSMMMVMLTVCHDLYAQQIDAIMQPMIEVDKRDARAARELQAEDERPAQRRRVAT